MGCCMPGCLHLSQGIKTCSIAGALQIMEGVACLKVPLTVNVSYGQRWGAMQRMRLDLTAMS